MPENFNTHQIMKNLAKNLQEKKETVIFEAIRAVEGNQVTKSNYIKYATTHGAISVHPYTAIETFSYKNKELVSFYPHELSVIENELGGIECAGSVRFYIHPASEG